MKNLRFLWVTLGAAPAGVGAAAALVQGCNSSNNNPPPAMEAGSDSSTPDTYAPDTYVGDTYVADTSMDSSDGGPVMEAGPVDASEIVLFPQTVARAYCQQLRFCCSPNDAGFDMNACYTSTLGQGGANGDGLGVYSVAIPADGGHIMFNPTSAQACLQDIASIPCGMVNSQTFLQIRSDCFGALVGTIPVGGTGCASDLDCAPQGYCDTATNTCTALAGDGGACLTNPQCSYRGSGSPAQYCDYNLLIDSGTRRCLPQGASGAMCGTTFYYNQECTTELCVSPGQCGTATVFGDPGVPGGVCAGLIPDGG